jgi:hypothetical protein
MRFQLYARLAAHRAILITILTMLDMLPATAGAADRDWVAFFSNALWSDPSS